MEEADENEAIVYADIGEFAPERPADSCPLTNPQTPRCSRPRAETSLSRSRGDSTCTPMLPTPRTRCVQQPRCTRFACLQCHCSPHFLVCMMSYDMEVDYKMSLHFQVLGAFITLGGVGATSEKSAKPPRVGLLTLPPGHDCPVIIPAAVCSNNNSTKSRQTTAATLETPTAPPYKTQKPPCRLPRR